MGLDVDTARATKMLGNFFSGVGNSDQSGTPGNATINSCSGFVAFATGVNNVTITSNQITANTKCFAMLKGPADATLTSLPRYVITAPSGGNSGTCQIFGNANSTGNPVVGFLFWD